MKPDDRQAGAAIVAFTDSICTGEAQRFENFAVVPLFSDLAIENGYTLLDDALATESFTVTEKDESGSVPELLVTNELEADVLVLDGEQLVGAKQNRVVNTTIVVVGKTSITLPVSCVERGRWSYRSERFASSPSPLYADLRAKKSRAVSKNLRESASFEADQMEIWDSISEASMDSCVASPTEAMEDLFVSNEDRIAAYESAFTCRPGQIGFVALVDGRVRGVDILGVRSLFPNVYRKLLRGYILDAVADRKRQDAPGGPATAAGEEEVFLRKIATATKTVFDSTGAGTDVRVESDDVTGFALCRQGQVLHLAAFQQ